MLTNLLNTLARLFRTRETRVACPASVVAQPAPSPAVTQPQVDLPQVEQLVGRVTAMASSVAQDVGQHNANLEAISAELTAVAQSDPKAVATIVCKLVEANRDLQGRLQTAEKSLQDHSQRLKAAMSTARTDGLTGLLNRRALDDELQRCLTRFQKDGTTTAFLMLDLDHFKQFNDAHGHVAGDQALTQTAEILRQHSRPTDIVARYGGEEFAVAFVASTAAAVRQRAEQLRGAIGQRPIRVGSQQLQITASAGLAEIAAGDSAAQWITRADRALYAAKQGGRDCACEARGTEYVRLSCAPCAQPSDDPAASDHCESKPARCIEEASADLAAEAFADTTFPQQISRRIAEWRRGGATLTVMLARLDDPVRQDDDVETNEQQSPTRVALQVGRCCIREMDLISRWISNGLAFLLPSTSVVDAKVVARRLRAALASSETGNNRPRLSISIGIAEGIEGNDARRVLERAWLALEAARAAGNGHIYVHDGLKSVAVKQAAAAAR